MPNQNLQRLAPLTGVLAIVLVFVSFFVQGEPPSADEGPRKIVEWYTDHEGQTIFAALLASLGAVSLIFFAATVRRAMRRTEQAMGVLSMAVLAGGAVAATGIATDSALRFALADQADEISPVAVQALHGFWEAFFFPMVVGLGTLILALSLGSLRTRVIPVWLAWIGILLFVVFFTPAGFIAFLASALWTIVVSILLWRQEPAAATTGVA
jgi:hypothetical protein